MPRTLTAPPAFDPTQWSTEIGRPPRGYDGTQFGCALVSQLLEPRGDNAMSILGRWLRVDNRQLEPVEFDHNYPIYFEITRCFRFL